MKNNKTIILTLLLTSLIVLSLPGISLSTNKSFQHQETKKQENLYAGTSISVKIIQSGNKTFGYDILINGRILIHQPNRPAMPGNEGFQTQKQAQKVAEFVVNKIRKNEMPPTVTIVDLNRMGVLK